MRLDREEKIGIILGCAVVVLGMTVNFLFTDVLYGLLGEKISHLFLTYETTIDPLFIEWEEKVIMNTIGIVLFGPIISAVIIFPFVFGEVVLRTCFEMTKKLCGCFQHNTRNKTK